MARPISDVIVIGSGPNGLSAAIELCRAGLSVRVIEAADRAGGGARSAELTLPGFVHDVCSAIHPMAAGSPFFRTLPLAENGLSWVHPDIVLAHPLDDGRVAVVRRSVEETARSLGFDAASYVRLMAPFADRVELLFDLLLRPLRVSRAPFLTARFGWHAVKSCSALVRGAFADTVARSLFTGCSAHAALDPGTPGTAAFGLMLLLAGHGYGWPCARGGSQRIADALVAHLLTLGGTISLGEQVRSLTELPPSRAVVFDLVPKLVAEIAAGELPASYRDRLLEYPHGPGVFKLDWALDGPIPWRIEECGRAGTVHLGGSFEQIASYERAVSDGKLGERPYVLLAQQSVFDGSRAPEGRHTVWAYCHVPNGSDVDMTSAVEAEIERFAPGFRDRILGRRSSCPADLERRNPNLIGGDVGGGRNDLLHFLARPVARLDPYATPNERLYICSSATPPGGGVHGMCGYWAAQSVLRRSFGRRARRVWP